MTSQANRNIAAFAAVLSLVLLMGGSHLTAQATPTGWTPELVMQVKRVGNVVPSPDGSRVAYQVGTAVMEGETSEWRYQIWVAGSDGSNAYQLTRGDKSSTDPSWSPDGAWLAFLSSRSDSANIWRIRIAGGEAEQVTHVKSGVDAFAWSPDGVSIAYSMPDPPTEEELQNEKEKNDAFVVDENLKEIHLYTIPVNVGDDGKREATRLTPAGRSVFGLFAGMPFDWSPDGSSIVFAHAPTPKVDDWTRTDLSVVDVATVTVRSLVNSSAAEGQPTYSPDGRWIAYTASDDPPTWAFTSRVHLVGVNDGESRPLAASYDEQPGIVGWSEDGRSVLISETHRTINRVSALPLDGGAPVDITPDNVMVSAPRLNVSGTFLGFVSETPDTPPEAFVSAIDRFQPALVSAAQDTPDVPIGETEVVTWNSSDGMEIEGLLTLPTGYEGGAPVPLLVIVHGGPTGVFTQRFIASRGAYSIASFAEKGFAVLRCNVRGSSGYGREFRYANYGDWGGGDYRDIMTGVDAMIERGIADPNALGVMGWSYGGYMTSWVVTQTDRFKAASVGAGVNNLMSFTGTADIAGFIPDYFGGEYWDVFDNWRSHSAMFNVKGVTTPTLIQHGEEDARVPVGQGYEFYNALKRQGVEVKMVVYPRQPHGIQEPRLQLDAMKRNLEWFERWVQATPVSLRRY
jgi:dipeptidyl aminopeptidase/acylaminoacyl peptidase